MSALLIACWWVPFPRESLVFPACLELLTVLFALSVLAAIPLYQPRAFIRAERDRSCTRHRGLAAHGAEPGPAFGSWVRLWLWITAHGPGGMCHEQGWLSGCSGMGTFIFSSGNLGIGQCRWCGWRGPVSWSWDSHVGAQWTQQVTETLSGIAPEN